MSHNYGDCYFCGGEIVERVIELEYRRKGRLYIIEGGPVGICQQCGEKYFTALVSEAIDRISSYLNRSITLEQMVDWAENVICEAEYEEKDFELIKEIFKAGIIQAIEKMEHEVGYHYEVLDKAKGNKLLLLKKGIFL